MMVVGKLLIQTWKLIYSLNSPIIATEEIKGVTCQILQRHMRAIVSCVTCHFNRIPSLSIVMSCLASSYDLKKQKLVTFLPFLQTVTGIVLLLCCPSTDTALS